jgi:basic amino acid/polyamine antiporter, APA family
MRQTMMHMPSEVRANQATQTTPTLVRGLSLFDSIVVLVGGIIGSAVFLTASDVAASVRYPALFMLVWVAGLLISMLACFAFAELGGMFPDAGGQYVYIREIYGEFVAFLYGWMIFTVSTTGTIAALAVAFAEYLGVIVPTLTASRVVWSAAGWKLTVGQVVATSAISFLTMVSVVGLRRSATFLNILTALKFGAIAVFVLLGFSVGKGALSNFSQPAIGAHVDGSLLSGFGVALIAVFFAYDGWVYITWVAGEVKEPRRNVPRALILGMLIVGALYITINAVYVYALGMQRIIQQTTVAQAAAVALFSPAAAWWISAMVALSCFGAASCAITTGARVFYAMANDGVFFRKLAEVHPRWRTPAFSLVTQGVWSIVLVFSGRYDQLFTYVMFMMVVSYVGTVLGVFLLRRRRPDMPRPYRCPGYPWIPAIYVVIAGLWALNTVWQRFTETLAGTIVVASGVPGYFYWRHRRNRMEQ